jgi:hypothetical protein
MEWTFAGHFKPIHYLLLMNELTWSGRLHKRAVAVLMIGACITGLDHPFNM